MRNTSRYLILLVLCLWLVACASSSSSSSDGEDRVNSSDEEEHFGANSDEESFPGMAGGEFPWENIDFSARPGGEWRHYMAGAAGGDFQPCIQEIINRRAEDQDREQTHLMEFRRVALWFVALLGAAMACYDLVDEVVARWLPSLMSLLPVGECVGIASFIALVMLVLIWADAELGARVVRRRF